MLRQNISETKRAINTGELFDADSDIEEEKEDQPKRDPKLPSIA